MVGLRGRAWSFLSKVLPMIVNQRFKRPVLGSCSAVAGFRRKVLASKKVPIPSVSVNVCRFESSLSLSRTLAAVDRNKIQIIGTVKYIETGKETKKKKKEKESDGPMAWYFIARYFYNRLARSQLFTRLRFSSVLSRRYGTATGSFGVYFPRWKEARGLYFATIGDWIESLIKWHLPFVCL